MKANRLVFFCDFCRKSQDEVAQIIGGPDNIAICNECVAICVELIKEEEDKKKDKDKP